MPRTDLQRSSFTTGKRVARPGPRLLGVSFALASVASVASVAGVVAAAPANAVAGYHVGYSSLIVRAEATRQSAQVGFIANVGTSIDIACQKHGEAVVFQGYTSDIWDKLNGYGGYISDHYVNETQFAKFDPHLSVCDTGQAPSSPSVPAAADSGGTIVGLAGKCADVQGGRSANGTAVQLYGCNGSSAQRWSWNGSTLRALGKCLDAAGGRTAAGTPVQLYDCNGTGAQNWQVSGGVLRNPQSNRCLDVKGGKSASGTPLQLWDCNGTAAQAWQVNSISVRAQHALDWARSAIGQLSTGGDLGDWDHVWEGWCDNFVAHAYGRSSSGYLTAIEHFTALDKRGLVTRNGNAPAGSLVFFAAAAVNGGAGHVAISDGSGGMITTTDSRANRKIAVEPRSFAGATYLGWSAADPEWPGR